MIFILFLVYVLRTGLTYYLVTEDVFPESEFPSKPFDLDHIVAVIFGEVYVVSFVTAIKFVVEWFMEKKKNEKLAQLQLSTELKYLRTQIQPHFFFNTLNNLYALTLKKSDNAPRVILKLSEMMQYVLYEVDSSRISLHKEINHINNFVDIERLRFGERVDFEMNITGNIEDIEIPPLLFLSFVENCFKHGLRDNDKIKIEMSFLVRRGYLRFRISNNFNLNSQTKGKHGIGIANAERRLSLLFHSDYVLETKVIDDIFQLYLKIPV